MTKPNSATEDPRQFNLGYWSYQATSSHPDKPALIDLFGDRERQTSYRELNTRLDRVAAMLAASGLRPGDRLAMAISNRTEFIEAMFGSMRAGLVPVPLSTRLGRETLDYIIRDAGCRAAIVEPASNADIAPIIETTRLATRLAIDDVPAGWQDFETELSRVSPAFEPPRLAPDHPAFQPYTSGSTGRPKGVILTHRGQLWWLNCLVRYWPPEIDGRALVAVPLYHKNAMAGAIKPRLRVGSTVVILPDFEPERFLRSLTDYNITEAGAVPAVFSLLLQHRELIDSLDFSALKSFSIGSAPVSSTLLQEVREAFGVEVSESYGLTEGGPVMIGPPLDGRPVPPGSCGVAWPEGELKLVNADGEEDEHYGELWVRNPGVTPGYHNLPEVNAQRLVDGWLRTGDLFYRDDEGFYYFRGRVDDMFKCGGESIYPKEVENLLLSHRQIVDACVVPVSHSIKGHVPAALVMLEHPDAVTVDEIRQFCLDHGPAYAHPRFVLITEQMPLNNAGKIDRNLVKHRFEERFRDRGTGGNEG